MAYVSFLWDNTGLEATQFVCSRMETWAGSVSGMGEEGLSYPFRSFAHFLTGLLVLLSLSFMSSFSILDTSPLSAMCFANILSQPVASLFKLLIYVFRAHGGWGKLAWYSSSRSLVPLGKSPKLTNLQQKSLTHRHIAMTGSYTWISIYMMNGYICACSAQHNADSWHMLKKCKITMPSRCSQTFKNTPLSWCQQYLPFPPTPLRGWLAAKQQAEGIKWAVRKWEGIFRAPCKDKLRVDTLDHSIKPWKHGKSVPCLTHRIRVNMNIY